ncbi:MAG: D-lyxose/D-mannose family sugar isomerase [Oscillospiraceae bacterium]|jgi:D-lyxose ketol-isomerase|nr:D-lyxose/D-mannose family sugar isomerase [Oscillospiraceae bacterium]
MERSRINAIIDEAIAFVNGRGMPLPRFARWSPGDWAAAGDDCREIIDNMLGWDVTDFGSGDFVKTGLTIFTFRNGNILRPESYPKPYAEKMLLVGERQDMPYHFHWKKMEDIINRGGGNLLVTLYNSDREGGFAGTDVHVTMDGRKVVVPAGGTVRLEPGDSITLLPGQYHNWISEEGTGKVMLFEVSSPNDDNVDNRFYEDIARLPEIIEDEPARYLLFKDYGKLAV